VTEFAVGQGYRQLEGIAAGPDDNVWFAETHANTIARHPLPPAATAPARK
jgi:streptogramin lyase